MYHLKSFIADCDRSAELAKMCLAEKRSAKVKAVDNPMRTICYKLGLFLGWGTRIISLTYLLLLVPLIPGRGGYCLILMAPTHTYSCSVGGESTRGTGKVEEVSCPRIQPQLCRAWDSILWYLITGYFHGCCCVKSPLSPTMSFCLCGCTWLLASQSDSDTKKVFILIPEYQKFILSSYQSVGTSSGIRQDL